MILYDGVLGLIKWRAGATRGDVADIAYFPLGIVMIVPCEDRLYTAGFQYGLQLLERCFVGFGNVCAGLL